jgi:hypothetical protein
VTGMSEQAEPAEAPRLPNGGGNGNGNGGGHCTPSHSLFVNATASPDLDPDTPNVQVVAGTMMQLTGISEEITITFQCDFLEADVPFSWALTFQPPGGSETDITAQLTAADTLNPTFLAASEGTYRARLTGSATGFASRTSLVEIDAAPPPPVLLERTGLITFLRAHDLGSGFGPPTDFIDVEAVIKLDTAPDEAYGFELRNDRFRPSRQAMFDLLREAYFSNRSVTIDYFIIPGRHNGRIFRVALIS